MTSQSADIGLLLLFIRYAGSSMFIRSGVVKLASLQGFESAVAGYKLLPKVLVKPIAFAVALTEALCGLLVFLGIYGSLAFFVLAFLLLVFAVAMGINLARGQIIDCGCGGVKFAVISWRHVRIDILLAACAAGMAVAFPSVMVIASGPGAVFAVAVPASSALGILLAALLCLVMARVLRATRRAIFLADSAR